MKHDYSLDEHTIIPVWSTVAVKRDESRLWIQRTIIQHGNEEHNGCCYKRCNPSIGRIGIKNARHIK